MDPDQTRYFGRHSRDPVPRGGISGAWRTSDLVRAVTPRTITLWVFLAGAVVILGFAAGWFITKVTTP